MERIALLVILLVTIFAWAEGQDKESWAKRVESGKEVVTTLQFYFHDKLSGSNPSAVRIAQAAETNNSATIFGALMMIDDPLTIGPDPTSKLLGRARGLYGSAGQTDLGLIMVINYGFTDGIYQGSSFSLLSLNPAMNPVREMAIVGGTGLFRLARGYAIAQTYSANPNGDAIVGYNVTIVTYI
ncbi:dirigent protein 23-like [Nicotiana tabacum]|uniref:Dirigent protein n=1 Tax=Nicotiana tabacum TaxID=4097 RepID=A0A1S4CZ34_TOBAC|nr:dirigent protein 23-like [Nicotiana tomentosiformis]XP_016506264.1 PREDICTED: dirigent protein 23-like [Nicotiana tabacum]